MKNFIVMIFAVAALATSCKNTKKTETENSAVARTATTPVTKSKEDLTSQSSASEKNTVADNSSTSGKPALNPAHGEPYHRCDIAVGAPIDSPAPVQNAAPQVVQPQSIPNAGFNTNPISPSAAPSVSSSADIGPKPAINPPHGQPHHRCDLQVGAPLT